MFVLLTLGLRLQSRVAWRPAPKTVMPTTRVLLVWTSVLLASGQIWSPGSACRTVPITAVSLQTTQLIVVCKDVLNFLIFLPIR